MSLRSKPDGKQLDVRELCVLALMGALIFATKFALAGLPNINLNTLLIILCVSFFGWKTLYAVFIYVMLEGLVFGFTLWWFSYLYAWPVVTAAAMLFRRNRSPFFLGCFRRLVRAALRAADVYPLSHGHRLAVGCDDVDCRDPL